MKDALEVIERQLENENDEDMEQDENENENECLARIKAEKHMQIIEIPGALDIFTFVEETNHEWIQLNELHHINLLVFYVCANGTIGSPMDLRTPRIKVNVLWSGTVCLGGPYELFKDPLVKEFIWHEFILPYSYPKSSKKYQELKERFQHIAETRKIMQLQRRQARNARCLSKTKHRELKQNIKMWAEFQEWRQERGYISDDDD
ncbi:MAG: hypothetical protein ACTSUE_05030 [Promethearchaeota archaeon]